MVGSGSHPIFQSKLLISSGTSSKHDEGRVLGRAEPLTTSRSLSFVRWAFDPWNWPLTDLLESHQGVDLVQLPGLVGKKTSAPVWYSSIAKWLAGYLESRYHATTGQQNERNHFFQHAGCTSTVALMNSQTEEARSQVTRAAIWLPSFKVS